MITPEQRRRLNLTDEKIADFAGEAQCAVSDLTLYVSLPWPDSDGMFIPTLWVRSKHWEKRLKEGKSTNAAGPANVRAERLGQKYATTVVTWC